MSDELNESEKRLQHSRKFRDEFLEFIDDWKKESDDGEEEHPRSFFLHTELDYEESTDLQEYFDRAGLDIGAPGHWQFLLVALTNFVHLERPGVKPFSFDENRDFVRDMAALKKENKVSKLKLGEMWVENERAAGRKPASPTTTRTRLQEQLKLLRTLRDEGKTSPEETEWVEILDEPIKRKSPT